MATHPGVKDVLDFDCMMPVELLCMLPAIMEHLDDVAILKQGFQLC